MTYKSCQFVICYCIAERKKRDAGQAATLLAHALVDHLNTGCLMFASRCSTYDSHETLDTTDDDL